MNLTSGDPATAWKVLHVLDHSLPHLSGYAIRSRSIFDYQRRLGFEPIVVTSPKQGPSASPREEIDGVVYHRTNPSDANLNGWAGRVPFLREFLQVRGMRHAITRLARQTGVNILHAHSPSLNGMPARDAAHGLGLPMVYEIRAFWEDAAVDHGSFAQGSLRYRISRVLETRLVRKADAVVVICEGLRGELIGRGIDPQKITIVPNGVDYERYSPCDPDLALLDRYGLRGKTVLGFIGSFYRYEGLPLLLDMMAHLRQTHPDVRLLLVGGGEEDVRLRSQCKEMNLDGVVQFTGPVPPAAVNAHYSIMDLLIYPRNRERITEWVTPLKPLEAMAMAKVVVGSDVGGIRELITDGENGFLFEAGSGASLGNVVTKVLAARERWGEFGSQARAFVIRERNWGSIVARYREVYTQAQQRSKGNTARRSGRPASVPAGV